MTSRTTTGRSPIGEVLRAVATLAWTATLIVGVPWALTTFFGWPLPRQIPDWNQVVSTPIQLLDPTVILNFFVCLAWIAWAIIIGYLLVDIVDVARGLGQRIHRLGPLSGIAGKLVASAVLLVTLARQPSGTASPYRPTPITYIADFPAPEPSASPGPAVAAPSDVAAVRAAPSDPTYVVCRGDSLWSLAEAHLASGFRWQEIYDLNRDLIGDPDYIEIDQTLVFPADATGLEVPAELEREPAPSPPAPPFQIPPAPEPIPAPPQTLPVGPTTSAAPAATTDGTATTSPEWSERPADVARPSADSAQEVGLADWSTSVPVVPGIAGATALASGLLLALLRGRRRLSAHGIRLQRGGRELERAILAAADIPLIRWAGQELAALAESINDRTFDAGPVAVEFSAETGLEILWDRPVWSQAPRPWEAVPGGWAWRCLYDPEAPVPDADQTSPVAGLVTFGQRGGRQLLVDLESLGSLAVTGDPTCAENFVRSLVLELGANDDLSDAYVFAVEGALDIDGAEHLDRVQHATIDQVHDRLVAAANSTCECIDGAASSGFAYRTRQTDPAGLEVYVAVARSSADVDSLIDVASARSGAVTVVLGDASTAAALTIDVDGIGRLEPLGLTFDAAGVGRDLAAQVAVLLDDTVQYPPAIDPEPSEPYPIADSPRNGAVDIPEEQRLDLQGEAEPTDLLAVIDLTEPAIADELDDDWSLPAVRLLVQVLGVPAIRDRPQLGRRELMVVVYAACMARPVAPDDIQNAIWGGDAVSAKTVSNLIGHTRTALGEWDQQPILSRVSSGTMHLADGVYSDHRLFEILTDRAAQVPSSQAAPLLHQALDLIDGPPFNADGYEWAHVSQLVAEIEARIERAALDLVNLELEAGDVEEARRAVMQGLRALPGNEVLYRERVRIEETAGNMTAARSALMELIYYLEDLGTEPSNGTIAQYGHLIGDRQRR